MITKIINERGEVFETNSSSTHSICVSMFGDIERVFPNKNGEVRVEDGTPVLTGDETKLFHFSAKIVYLLTTIFNACKADEITANLNRLKNIVKIQTGGELVIVPKPDEFYNYEEGIEDLYAHRGLEILKHGDSVVRNFLFNTTSYIGYSYDG